MSAIAPASIPEKPGPWKMLSPSTSAAAWSPTCSDPMTNASASPFGSGCTA